ncbi:hypothetical protein C7M22_03667 [Bacillus velezensis]|nr:MULTISPECIES: hypothetical protein [Bacillus amyloliquefaciens group]QHK65709.1 hypothetical protein C7M22_03667 [Bacillus velezensis]QHL98557.1 hypothetical protein C7M25_02783 [Bacillus velezensis]QYJ63523.1 hypothetical protein J8615_10750 [Bacillus velezensis]
MSEEQVKQVVKESIREMIEDETIKFDAYLRGQQVELLIFFDGDLIQQSD